MTCDQLLVELSRLGIRLQAAGGQLSISAPKGSLSPALREAIGQYKTDILAWLDKRDGEEKAAVPAITPAPEDWRRPFPLADLQVGFYLGSSESMEYHVRPHYYFEMDYGDLDIARYQDAWHKALVRHRASLPIVTRDLELQIIPEVPPLAFPVNDLRHLPPDEAEARMLAIRRRMEREELPLDRWPWFDWQLTRYGNNRIRVHFNSNNFFSDGYGTAKLLAQVKQFYADPELQLPPLELSFRDCVLALQSIEASELGRRSLAYWRERLPLLPKPPALPQVPNANPRCRSRLTRRSRILPATDWRAFKANAGRRGLTPTGAIYAVYAEVLSKWSGSNHFILNNMVTHRFPMHGQVKEIIGNFASLYPLEVDWRGGPSFADRAQRLQERLFTDLDHIYCSGMGVLQELNKIQGTPGRAPCPHVVGSGLFMESWETYKYSSLETSQTQLDHQFWELDDERYYVVWDLMAHFFPAGLVDAMWEGYIGLILRLGREPGVWDEKHLLSLPVDQEARRTEGNTTAMPVAECLLSDFLARAARDYPEQAAVVTPERSLTYRELAGHANRIGRRLRTLGAKPNRLVAVAMDKGWEQVAAVAGILAAGAAYVPIDPAMPSERLAHLLSNARVELVLTQGHVDQSLDWPEGIQRLVVGDGEWDAIDAHPLAPVQTPADIAYVIYTSGSTGEPKGVVIDHRGAVNTVLDINQRFSVGPADRLFGISSLSFDLSVYDLFGAFAAAATLVLPAATATRDPARWLGLLSAQGVTVWNSAPALMQLLVDSAPAGTALPDLRLVLMSGDWIPVPLPDRIRSLAPGVRVVSLGGATEASIWSIFYPIGEVNPAWPSIPYGKALGNQRWHVLDEEMQPCPDWVVGDLYIAGIGLAQGYWRDEEKTARSFVLHPETGEKLYRTGDLGRYLPDGNIEFLGRRDFQVKIQGYRIELGEIEAALLRHPLVKDAVAAVRDDGRNGKRLVAYLVPRPEAPLPPDGDELRDFLRRWLPEYMLPGSFVPLAALPLSSNGKVDRKALPAPQAEGEKAKGTRQAPRDEVEEGLAAIWKDLLGVEALGVNDDFFDLGGQSFTAIRMLVRVAERFGRPLPLATVLEGRTIEHLARRLREAGEATPWTPLVRLHGGSGTPWFLVHPAGGSVMGYRELAGRLLRPLWGLEARGLHGEGKPLTEVEAMAHSYVEAIRGVQARGPYTLGGWSSGGIIAFEMARQLESQGEVVERVILLDSPSPLQHDPVDDATLLAWFLEDLNIGFPVARLDLDALRRIPSSQLLDQALAGVPLPAGGSSQELAPVWAVFRAVIAAGRCYRAGFVQAPLWVLRAEERIVSEFADHPADSLPDWGWSCFAQGDIRTAAVAGNHHSFLLPPQLDRLVEILGDLGQQSAGAGSVAMDATDNRKEGEINAF